MRFISTLFAALLFACGHPDPELSFSTPGGGGADVQPSKSALLGNWAQSRIGNCINDEAWLTFDAPDALRVTSVDRNFCQGHSVEASKGTWKELAGGLLELAWTTPDGKQNASRVTKLVKNGGASFTSVPIPEGYVVGDRGLNVSSFSRAPAGGNTFMRESSSTLVEGGKTYAVTRLAELSLDVDPATVALPATCNMTVTVTIDLAWGDAPAEKGKETFGFPCRIVESAEEGVRLTANGFEGHSPDWTWSEYLTAQGVWSRYSGHLGSHFHDFFRPILLVDRAEPDALIQSHYDSWYAEMKTPPPDRVD